MKVRNSIILSCILFAVLGTIWYTFADQEAVAPGPIQCEGKVGPDVGYCAPNFTLKTMEGEPVELYQSDGRPTVINFWASWCEPCKKEMPMLQKAYDQYGEQVRFLLVNQLAQDNLNDVKAYLKSNRYTFPILLDKPNEQQKTVGMNQYNVLGVPMTFAVNTDGKITHRIAGEMSEQQLQQILNKLLD